MEVTTPEDHMGDVIGDLNSRRGLVGEFLDKPGNMRVRNLTSSHLMTSSYLCSLATYRSSVGQTNEVSHAHMT